ncbi:MAG TPA: hypothetical protein DIT89_14195 [Planctomycetaceae bacterium]|nr:hypothetical protein [Planctomycetaceae bacterium]
MRQTFEKRGIQWLSGSCSRGSEEHQQRQKHGISGLDVLQRSNNPMRSESATDREKHGNGECD